MIKFRINKRIVISFVVLILPYTDIVPLALIGTVLPTIADCAFCVSSLEDVKSSAALVLYQLWVGVSTVRLPALITPLAPTTIP